MFYTLLKQDDVTVLTVLNNGQPLVATSTTHPNFSELVGKVIADDESALDMFVVENQVAAKFDQLSERVTVRGGEVYFDGDLVDNALADQIVRFMEDGVSDWAPLVSFFEKVMQNPSEHSREQLFRFLAKHAFTLTQSGDIVGYKSVNQDFGSIHAGPAIVDGQEVNGHVPNNVGSTIEMARGQVQFDPSVACASGLHVANWDYASTWAGSDVKLLEVHVNPRDVVSVPSDANDAKVRVCRYYVANEVTEPYSGPVLVDDSIVDEYTEEELDEAWENMTDGWDDDDDFDYATVNPWLDVTVTDVTTATKVDTRLNHLAQKRGPGGRFLPKGS